MFYIILGCFLDGISSVVLTMAVVEPMIREAGIYLIRFGIFIVIVVKMVRITPPIGFNLFVWQGMTKHEMSYIALAAIPMFLILVVMVFALIGSAVTQRALTLIKRQPGVGAIILECANLPTYKAQVAAATGLPVFDSLNCAHLLWSARTGTSNG